MLEDHISSYFDGRIRLRHPVLTDTAAAAQVQTLLAAVPGVQEVRVNTRIGSLLLCWDPAQLSCESLQALLRRGEFLLGAYSTGRSTTAGRDCARLRRWGNRLAPAVPAVCLWAGLRGNLRLHAAAGSLFLLWTAQHLWRVRRTL